MVWPCQNPNRTPSEHPNPTTKIGSKMGGEFTNPNQHGIPKRFRQPQPYQPEVTSGSMPLQGAMSTRGSNSDSPSQILGWFRWFLGNPERFRVGGSETSGEVRFLGIFCRASIRTILLKAMEWQMDTSAAKPPHSLTASWRSMPSNSANP